MATEEILDGALGFGDEETDFLIEGETELPPTFKQDDIRFQYHQGNTPHCTLISSIGALSDLQNYEFTKENIDEVIKMSVERGKPIDKGRYTKAGVKCVADRWNAKFPEKKVLYFKLDLLSNVCMDILKKGYTVVVTYKGNSAYQSDYYKDAILDGNEFGAPTYGHATTVLMFMENGKLFVKDSYKGRKGKGGIDTNIYQVRDIEGLIKNGVYYPSAYVYVQENTIQKTEEELKRLTNFKNLLTKNIEGNSQMRFLTTQPEFKDRLNEVNNIYKDKLNDVNLELKKL